MYQTSGYSKQSGYPSYAKREEGWTENFDFQDQRSRDLDRNQYGVDPRFRYESEGNNPDSQQRNPRRTRTGGLNFNKYAETGNSFINEVALVLGTGREDRKSVV